MKACSKCGERKEFSAFPPSSKNKKLPDAWCRSCRAAASKLYRLLNLEKVNAASTRWSNEKGPAWRESNRERMRAHQRAYRVRNKAKCLEANRIYRKSEKYKSKERAYFSSPERKTYMYEYCQRRNASKLKATPKWANVCAMRAIYAQAAELRRKDIDVHVDHVVPLKSTLVCGLHCEANLQIIPADHNHRKFNLVWPDMPPYAN